MGVLLAGLSALLYGSADFAGGYAARRSSALSVVVVSQIFGVATALAAVPIVGFRLVDAADLLWGGLAGIGGALGLIALYRGIADSIVAVVSPTSALLGAVVPLVFGLAVGERPGSVAWAGVALCLPAVVLLSVEGGGAGTRRLVGRSLAFGAAAGAGFGLFFIAITRPAPSAGLWPLVAARSVSVLLVAFAAFAARRNPLSTGGRLPVLVAAGVFDMAANVAFVLSTRYALLALSTTVASLFPGPTVLLGRILFGERIGPLRAAGFACAVAGVALIGIGSIR